MSFHFHHISFDPIDPLGDGLREEIIAEQSDPERIVLEERPSEGELVAYLESITNDIQEGSDQLTYTED